MLRHYLTKSPRDERTHRKSRIHFTVFPFTTLCSRALVTCSRDCLLLPHGELLLGVRNARSGWRPDVPQIGACPGNENIRPPHTASPYSAIKEKPHKTAFDLAPHGMHR